MRDHVMRTESSDSITSPPMTTLMPKVGRLVEVRVEKAVQEPGQARPMVSSDDKLKP